MIPVAFMRPKWLEIQERYQLLDSGEGLVPSELSVFMESKVRNSFGSKSQVFENKYSTQSVASQGRESEMMERLSCMQKILSLESSSQKMIQLSKKQSMLKVMQGHPYETGSAHVQSKCRSFVGKCI
jgi:hypothetical protein